MEAGGNSKGWIRGGTVEGRGRARCTSQPVPEGTGWWQGDGGKAAGPGSWPSQQVSAHRPHLTTGHSLAEERACLPSPQHLTIPLLCHPKHLLPRN